MGGITDKQVVGSRRVFAHPDQALYYYPSSDLETISIDEDQVRNLVRRAWQKPRGRQLFLAYPDGNPGEPVKVRLLHAPGGRLLMHPEDAKTALGAALGAAFERAGLLCKLGISPSPFSGGTPIKPTWRR